MREALGCVEARVKDGRVSLRYSAGSKVGDAKFGKVMGFVEVVVVVSFSGEGERGVRMGGVEVREAIVLV